MKFMVNAVVAVLLLFFVPFTVTANEEPLWELGGGAVLFTLPHYLGSDQETGYLLPLPYFIYRGERLQADRSGIRSFLYNSDKLDLNLSFGGSLPVNNDDNDARAGMDDLDLLLEVGPTLQYTLFETDQQLLRFDIPARAAFTVGEKLFNHQGWTGNPRIHYETVINQWQVTATLGVVYSDRRYHGYFYNVNQRDVIAGRGVFQARSGFTGSRFTASVRRRYGDLAVGAFVQYYDLEGAENEDSPLVRKGEYVSASLFVAWIFARSTALVGQ